MTRFMKGNEAFGNTRGHDRLPTPCVVRGDGPVIIENKKGLAAVG